MTKLENRTTQELYECLVVFNDGLMITRTKVPIGFIPTFVIMLLLCLSGTVRATSTAVQSNTVNPSQDSCLSSIAAQLNEVSVNDNVASQLATRSSTYQALTEHYLVRYEGYSVGYKYDSACDITTMTVDLNFLLNGTRILLVSEDASATRVLNVTLEPGMAVSAENVPSLSALWSGYELYAPSNVQMWEAEVDYNQTTVSDPNPSSKYCDYESGAYYCTLLTWTGLESAPGYDDDGIAQAGTAADDNWTSGTQHTYYQMWTEFYPTQSVIQLCSESNDISAGDSVVAWAYNYAASDLSDDEYQLIVTDNTQHMGCGQSSYTFSYMGASYYAAFITEEPIGALLPKFTTYSMTSYVLYQGGSYEYVQPLWNDGYYNPYTIVDGSTTEAYPGSVSSSVFDTYWSSSN